MPTRPDTQVVPPRVGDPIIEEPPPYSGPDPEDYNPADQGSWISSRPRRRDVAERTLTAGANGQIHPYYYGKTQGGAFTPYGFAIGSTLYLQYFVGEGPLESIEELGFGDSLETSFAALGMVEGTAYNVFLGTPDQEPDPILAGSQPAGVWRWAWPGTAYVSIKINLSAAGFEKVDPKAFRCVVLGRKVNDPRIDSSLLFEDRIYSDNPALALLDFVRNRRFGLGAADAQIDLVSFEEAADDCDEVIAELDGTEPASAPTVALGMGAGQIELGTFQWAMTRVDTAGVESIASPWSSSITIGPGTVKIVQVSGLSTTEATIAGTRLYRRKFQGGLWGPGKRIVVPDLAKTVNFFQDGRPTYALGGSPPSSSAVSQFRIGLRIGGEEGVRDSIDQIRDTFNAVLVYNNGLWQVYVDKARTPTDHAYDASSIVGLPTLRGRDPALAPSQVVVEFFNQSKSYKVDYAAWPPQPEATGDRVDRIIETHTIHGCPSYDQGVRHAKWRYARAHRNFDLEWQTGRMGALPLPMSIVTFSHARAGISSRPVIVNECGPNSAREWLLRGELFDEDDYDSEYHVDPGTDPPVVDPPPPGEPPAPPDNYYLKVAGNSGKTPEWSPEWSMAITVYCDQAAEATSCFERPSYIGGTRSSGAHVMSDFGDLHEQVIIGTHPDGYQVASGDYLRFEIYPEVSAAATFKTGVDLKFLAGPYLSDGPTLDQDGLEAAVGDRSPRMSRWTQVAISLEPFVGMTVDQLIAHFEDDTAGTYVVRLRQIVVTNGDLVTKEFWVGSSSGLPAEIPGVYLSSPESSLVNLLIDTDIVFGTPITVSTGTSYSVSADPIFFINTSGTGNMTFNLPDAGLLPEGKFYVFKNNHATNDLIIDPYSSQTIDGASTITLATQYEVATIVRTSSSTWARVD